MTNPTIDELFLWLHNDSPLGAERACAAWNRLQPSAQQRALDSAIGYGTIREASTAFVRHLLGGND